MPSYWLSHGISVPSRLSPPPLPPVVQPVPAVSRAVVSPDAGASAGCSGALGVPWCHRCRIPRRRRHRRRAPRTLRPRWPRRACHISYCYSPSGSHSRTGGPRPARVGAGSAPPVLRCLMEMVWNLVEDSGATISVAVRRRGRRHGQDSGKNGRRPTTLPADECRRGVRPWGTSCSTRSTRCTTTGFTPCTSCRSTSPTASSWCSSVRPAAASRPRCG